MFSIVIKKLNVPYELIQSIHIVKNESSHIGFPYKETKKISQRMDIKLKSKCLEKMNELYLLLHDYHNLEFTEFGFGSQNIYANIRIDFHDSNYNEGSIMLDRPATLNFVIFFLSEKEE